LLVQPRKVWLLSELADEAKVSLGQTHKTVDCMIEEELVEWSENNKLVLKDPARLLKAWEDTYPSYESQKFTFYSFEQDQSVVMNSLLKKAKDISFALSFFSGADLVAPFIRGVNKVQLYVRNQADVERLKGLLELQEVKSGANVEIYIPYDEGVFYKALKVDASTQVDVPVVSNVQLYMDLFNNPARGKEQAEHLRELKLGF